MESDPVPAQFRLAPPLTLIPALLYRLSGPRNPTLQELLFSGALSAVKMLVSQREQSIRSQKMTPWVRLPDVF